MSIYLLPGDIVFTQAPTLLGRLIRRFTRAEGEQKTETNHCGVITSGGYFLSKKVPSAWIVEALTKVKYHSLRKAYIGSKNKIMIYRPINLTYNMKLIIQQQAERYIGKSYGYFKIVLHFFDWIIGNRQFFRRLMVLDKYPICSYLVAKSFSAIGADFGIKAKFASPDDILDFCQRNEDKYKKIWGWEIL